MPGTTQPAEAIASMMDDTRISVVIGAGTMTIGELRLAFLADSTEKVLTTGGATRLFGYSSSTWAKWASDGEIEGAWKDADGGPWRLPRSGCVGLLDRRRQERGTAGRKRRRGPWKRL